MSRAARYGYPERVILKGKRQRGDDAPPGALAWLSARQRDLCLYCGCETWLPWDRRREARLRAAWDMPGCRSMACQLAFDFRMASVEHLRRRADGGDEAASNLAMACAYCNSTRHASEPSDHATAMQALRRAGRHPCFPA